LIKVEWNKIKTKMICQHSNNKALQYKNYTAVTCNSQTTVSNWQTNKLGWLHFLLIQNFNLERHIGRKRFLHSNDFLSFFVPAIYEYVRRSIDKPVILKCEIDIWTWRCFCLWNQDLCENSRWFVVCYFHILDSIM
jgi:hypothetical protein